MYYEIGDLESALNAYQHGLSVELAALDPSSVNIRVTYTNIADIYKHRCEYKMSLEYYEKVLSLQRRYECNVTDITNTLSSIGRLFKH